MDKDAAAIGWPNLKYAQVERERRWLCDEVPQRGVVGLKSISDLYIANTQLRVREVYDLETGDTVFKLARKADIAHSKRLITNIYLTRTEYDLLSQHPGERLRKVRHTIRCSNGFNVSVDVFSGDLESLVLMEREFDTDASMEEYQPPAFVGHEVTNDPRFSGGHLARHGVPRF